MCTTFLKRPLAGIAFLLAVYSQSALAENISGTWAFISMYGSTPYHYDMTFVEAGGVISGNGGSGGATWTIAGTISGNQVSWREDYAGSSYYADRVGTISGDSMSGTWSNASQNGTWTATRTGGTGGGTESDKRKTAISLFCNRGGVDLGTATCSVTVADQGPPPRTLPTGAVDFTASNGFFPASAGCVLQQVSFSPGVGACEVQFTVPAGFGIGIPFPIDATYPGNETLQASSTSHELIIAACVGVPGKSCPDSVGISFDGIPKIINNLISIMAECGSGGSPSSPVTLQASSEYPASGGGLLTPGGNCSMTAALGLDLDQLLKDIPQADLESLSQLYTNSPSKFKDAFLNYANQTSLLEAGYYQLLQENQGLVDDLQKIIEKNILNEDWTKIFNNHGFRLGHLSLPALSAAKASSKKKKKLSLLKLSKITRMVKSNKTGRIKLKLNARMKKLLPLLKQAGINTIPMKITVSVKQKNRSRKASFEKSVDVVL